MLLGLIVLLLVSMIIGALSRALVGGTRGGCVVSMAVGLIGALIGAFLSDALNATSLLVIGGVDIVWGTLGSVIFLVVLRLLTQRR